MKLDFIPASTRAAGLGAMMKGAGKLLRFIPISQPTLLVGPGASGRLGQAVAGFGHVKILVVTDAVIARLGLLKDLTDALTAGGAAYVVFDEITPDAPIPLIERGIAFYREHGCDAIVAVGGGSSIDASKAIAVSIANPKKSLRSLAGYFKGLNTPIPIYAVPTTAGTGSEVTGWATIWDRRAGKKYSLHLPETWPKAAIVDPRLTLSLPAYPTLSSGLDALSHALEAIWNIHANPVSDTHAVAAARRVFDDLRQGRPLTRSLFTENCNAYFSAEALTDLAASLGPLGTPDSFTAGAPSLRGGLTFRGFTITYAGKRTLRLSTFVTPDGRYEQYLIAPTD